MELLEVVLTDSLLDHQIQPIQLFKPDLNFISVSIHIKFPKPQLQKNKHHSLPNISLLLRFQVQYTWYFQELLYFYFKVYF